MKFALPFLLFLTIAEAQEPCPKFRHDESPTYQAFVAAIRNPSCNVKSVADAIKILPSRMHADYVLFNKSRSIQGPERIILSSEKLKVSITPDPKLKGGNRIEILEINTDGGPEDLDVFKYYEIEFPSSEKQAKAKSWQTIQSGIKTSHANQQKCAACHGNPARPIYPGYPIWEGAIGGMDKGEGIITNEERAYLKRFLKDLDNRKNPRLNLLDQDVLKRPKSLSPKEAGGSGYPYMQLSLRNETLNASLGNANALRIARLLRKTPDYDRYKFAVMAGLIGCESFEQFLPQTEMNSLMTTMNRRFDLEKSWPNPRIEQKLRAIHRHNNHFLLSGYVLKPTPDLTVPPGTDMSKYSTKAPPDEKVPYNEFQKSFKQDFGSSPDMLRLYLDTIHVQGLTRADPAPANLRLLMEGRGLNIHHWFLDLTQPTYRLQDGAHGAELAASELLRLENMDDPTLTNYKYNDYSTKQPTCERLKELSLASLSAPNTTNEQPTEATACCTGNQAHANPVAALPKLPLTPTNAHRLMTDKCDNCHNPDYGHAPEIPFRSEQDFNKWLSRPGNREKILFRLNTQDETKRMPRTERLENDDRELLLKYLKSSAR